MICRNHRTPKAQPNICAAAAKRFGRQNHTSAALRCYAASLRAARDPALVGDVGVFAATDPRRCWRRRATPSRPWRGGTARRL